MKKWIWKLVICLALTAFSIHTGNATASYAKVSKERVHKAYEKKIKKIDKEWKKKYKGWYANGANYFAYHDLNKDGIDECFVVYSGSDKGSMTSNGGTEVAIYTYYNGKVRKLVYSRTGGGGNWGGIYFYKNRKYIDFHERGGWTFDADTYKAIKKGKLVSVGKSEAELDNEKYNETGEQIWNYKINGKKVSKKKYEAYQKTKASKKELKMYKITNSNLKKYR